VTGLKVIIVTPDAPDPFGNAAARWYYALAKGLVQRGHRLRFLSAYPSVTGRKSLERARDSLSGLGVSLQAYPYPVRPWLMRKWNTIRRPYSYFLSEELLKDVNQSMRGGYDIVNLEQMWTGYLGIGIERALLSVHHLELVDLAGVSSGSLKFLASKHLMQRAERFVLRSTANIRVTTDRLQAEVAKVNPNARIFAAPVAIDPELYEWAPRDRSSKTVGLIASFGWSPGYNAAIRLLTRVWPRVKRAVPDANLLIVGWNARQALGPYLHGLDVTIVENVPDTKDYFRRLSVLVYPLSQGSGMKIKLLEAMAYGTPVVTTTEGAEGLSVANGRHSFIIDDDEGIAERTVELLLNNDLGQRMSRAARELVEAEYSPGPVVAKMESIYELILGNG
jgi:glycosyltransferase involved in cell wall biosynthesis